MRSLREGKKEKIWVSETEETPKKKKKRLTIRQMDGNRTEVGSGKQVHTWAISEMSGDCWVKDKGNCI